MITKEQFLEIWKGSVDELYSQSLIEAGEGNGFEAYTQFFAILERVSRAIEVTTQSLFIQPWSGQLSSPASGESHATVTLSITRTGLVEKLFVLSQGDVLFEEQTTDWGVEQGQTVLTGRKYVVAQTNSFLPGDKGPIEIVVRAERPGWGYNNPLPNTISVPVQPAALFENDSATVIVRSAPSSPSPSEISASVMIAQNEPDVPVPEHRGQYFVFTNGTNTAKIGRVIAYASPTLVGGLPIDGGRVELAIEYVFDLGSVVGTFQLDELVQLQTSGNVVGWGRVVGIKNNRLALQLISGVVGDDVFGDASGASGTVDHLIYANDIVNESNTAEWRVLRWDIDVGLSILHEESPSGGRLGMLDLLGAERDIYRAPLESDESYRQRVWNIADTVSPNAIKRALNRVLGAFGITHTLREVGYDGLPGVFMDAGGSSVGDDTHTPEASPEPRKNFAFDMDPSLRPDDYWKVMLNLLEMRAFFLVGLPRRNDGDFGMFFDGSTADPQPTYNAFDRSELDAPSAFDGVPIGTSEFQFTAWDAVASVKAAGVGYDFVIDPEL